MAQNFQNLLVGSNKARLCETKQLWKFLRFLYKKIEVLPGRPGLDSR